MSDRTVAIVQARMGSSRLAGKVLLPLGRTSVLGNVIHRVRAAESVDEVVVVTSRLPSDEAIVHECATLDVRCFRGSESDVLSRFALAARAEDADIVVRITADCPLVSPTVIDDVVSVQRETGVDYASNTLERTFPVGLDVECITTGALQSAFRESREASEREHVTPFIYNQPERFAIASMRTTNDISALRLTLDWYEDYVFLRSIAHRYPRALSPDFSWTDVVSLVQQSDDLRTLQMKAREAARNGGEANASLK